MVSKDQQHIRILRIGAQVNGVGSPFVGVGREGSILRWPRRQICPAFEVLTHQGKTAAGKSSF